MQLASEEKCHLMPMTHSNFSTAVLKPVHDVFERVLSAVRPNGHRRLVVGAEKVMIAVCCRYVSSILAQVEHYAREWEEEKHSLSDILCEKLSSYLSC